MAVSPTYRNVGDIHKIKFFFEKFKSLAETLHSAEMQQNTTDSKASNTICGLLDRQLSQRFLIDSIKRKSMFLHAARVQLQAFFRMSAKWCSQPGQETNAGGIAGIRCHYANDDSRQIRKSRIESRRSANSL